MIGATTGELPGGAMQAMDVVSSSEDRSLRARCSYCMQHRVVLMALTAIVAVVVTSTVLGTQLTKGGDDEPWEVPESRWSVQVNLDDNESYRLESTHTSDGTADINMTVPTGPGLPPMIISLPSMPQTRRIALQYAIDELCGSEEKAYTFLRFLMTNYTSNVQESALQGLSIPVTGGSTNISELFRDGLTGLSVTTKLGRDGHVITRDESALTLRMDYVFGQFVDSLQTENPLTTDQRTAIKLRLNALALRAQRQAQDGVFPYLTAAPADTSVVVGDSWRRSFPNNGISANITYTLRDLVTDGRQPAVTYQPAVDGDNSAAAFNFTLLPVGTNTSARDAGPHGGFLVLDILSNFSLTDPALLTSMDDFQDAQIPALNPNDLNVTTFELAVVMRGLLVVGAKSGVVLDGYVVSAGGYRSVVSYAPGLVGASTVPNVQALTAADRTEELKAAVAGAATSFHKAVFSDLVSSITRGQPLRPSRTTTAGAESGAALRPHRLRTIQSQQMLPRARATADPASPAFKVSMTATSIETERVRGRIVINPDTQAV